MVSDQFHLPMNKVYMYHWSNNDNKDLEAFIQFPQDTVGKMIARLGRLQQEQPGNEDDPPLMGGSITAAKPSPITKGSKHQNGNLATDKAEVATNNKDVAISRKEGDDSTNNSMADALIMMVMMTWCPGPNPSTGIFAKS